MTNIKFDIAFDSDCIITITDISGYQPDSNTGFVSETGMSSDYKLSEGYFTNAIYYNRYKCIPALVNTGERWKQVVDPKVNYSDNFTKQNYHLAQDGVYTIVRLFLISKETYENSPARFEGKVVYYTDGQKIYKIVSGVPTQVTLADALTDKGPSTIVKTTVKFISMCYTEACYHALTRKLLENGCDECNTDTDKQIKRERDLYFMMLEAIKYLQEEGDLVTIQKLIQSIDSCGGICKKLMPTSKCGCNG